MAVSIYLETEDEITAAVSRIRALSEPEAVLVLSRGSRLGTSRINFKLLAREARASGVSLVAVSDEPTVRSLAVSAGVPAYETVAAAEDALHDFRLQDRQLAQRGPRLPAAALAPRPEVEPAPARTASGERAAAAGRSDRPDPRLDEATQSRAGAHEATRVIDAPSLPAPAAPVARPATGSARGARRLPAVPLLLIGLLGLVGLGALYAAYLYLPTASITLQPRTQPLGPLEVRVTADPSVAVVDAAQGIIPAQQIDLPLSVTGYFAATGVQVTREPASGTVRFRSENTLFDVPIPAGTLLATADGTEFETTTSVTVPKASFATGPTTATTGVVARAPGPRGNVPAGAIREVPRDLANALISVTNTNATTGGARVEQLAVTQADYDGAIESLTERLANELRARLDDPATAPRGLTVYVGSLQTDEPRPSADASELVDSPASGFVLTLSTTARVLAVNEALVGELAAERLRTSLSPGTSLAGNDVATSHTAGQVLGSTVVYRASASAQVYVEPDRQALLESVRGKPISEARAILEQHGAAEITVWPEIVDRLPEQVARINLTILPPREDP